MLKNITQHFGQDGLAPTASDHRSLGLGVSPALWLGAKVVVTTILTGMLLVPEHMFYHALAILAVSERATGPERARLTPTLRAYRILRRFGRPLQLPQSFSAVELAFSLRYRFLGLTVIIKSRNKMPFGILP